MIGAPYEGDGAIYVFRGSKDGLKPQYSQRITPSLMQQFFEDVAPVKSFGYSLDGGLDFDQNDYPDIMVGAFASNKLIALLTRPVVNIKVSATKYPTELLDPGAKQCGKNGKPLNCIELNVCFAYEHAIRESS